MRLMNRGSISEYSFFVPGIPVPKGRPRACRIGGRIHIYTPKATARWEKEVSRVAMVNRPDAPIDGPVYVELVFVMPRPKTAKKRTSHTVKPDLDNLEKAVLDAIQETSTRVPGLKKKVRIPLFYKNDSQVCGKTSVKRYPVSDEAVGVHILVAELEDGVLP